MAVAASASTAEGRGKAKGLGALSFLDVVVPFTAPLAAAVATGVYTGALGEGLPLPLRALLVGSGPLLVHVLYPAADLLLGPSRALAERHAQAQAQQGHGIKAPGADDFLSRLVPCLVVAAHLLVLFLAYGALAAVEAPPVPLAPPPPGLGEQLLLLPALVASMALSAAVAVAASHELVHSRHPAHLAAAWLFLTTHWWYPYFRAHHQHHLTVCTPADYSSAPRGLSVAAYLPRYIGGNYAEAWQLAAAECRRAGKPVFSFHNSCLVALVAQVAVTAGLALALGPVTAAVHCAVCAVLLTYMSVFDYVLHYGLTRPQLASASATAPGTDAAAGAAGAGGAAGDASGPGPAAAAGAPVRYAPVTPYNSWSSLYPFENALFFNVLLHGDHHMAASRSYAWLVPTPTTPTFPGPINALALSAFVPPLWRAAMDEQVDQANRANLQHLADLGVAAQPVMAAAGAQPGTERA